jgi:hypothetical protein
MRLPRRPIVGDRGKDIIGHKRAQARWKGASAWQKLMASTPIVRRKWLGGNEARAEAQRKEFGLRPGFGLDQDLFDVLLRKGYYKTFDIELIRQAMWQMPDLGPLYAGGPSLLDYAPTHSTSNIPLFPAFDTAFKAGMPIMAPETITVDTKDSSAYPGEALYATGNSGLRYWFGHLDKDWPLGTRIAKGAVIARVLDHNIGGGPHVHVGVNVERLLGSGQQLKWGRYGNGPNYTWGSPTIREQLAAALL